jgi:anti-anti-sigma factor
MTAPSTTVAATSTTVVPFDAELDVATVPALDRLLEQALAAHPTRLCVDLSACTFADGTACAALARWTAAADRQGARLQLCGVSSRLRRIIGLTGQDGLLLETDG